MPKQDLESYQTQANTESKKGSAMRENQDQRQADQRQADKKRGLAIVAFVTTVMAGLVMIPSGESSKRSSPTRCSGTGSQNCITEIRNLVTGSGKIIADEQYDGNGVFRISFVDYNRGGELFEATYFMNCDCEATNVRVQRL